MSSAMKDQPVPEISGREIEDPRRPDHEMIEPPPRGDRTARDWMIAGVAVYLGLATVFLTSLLDWRGDIALSVAEMVGLGRDPNWSVFVLVIGGIALTVAASLNVLRDIKAIRAEEDDIAWVLTHKRAGAALVLAPAGERERLLREGIRSLPTGANARVETLIDDRVRRAHAVRARGGAASIPVEELRIIAERRTARWGGFARYATSLLLLLAVLGTFAGVKTALPGLITAVSATGGGANADGSAVTNVGATIAAPLRAVADAFGANALALIGAIAVGLMAQGIGVGRRNVLERLELASAEHIYGDHAAQTADPLRAAIHALNETAQEIQNSSGALLGIEGGLEVLGSEFKSAIRSLDDRLTQILHHQESGLYERTSTVLQELQARVAGLAAVVDANTRLYAGLVDQIGERTAESREAIAQLQGANTQLSRALEGTIRLGDASTRASEKIDESSKLLVDATIQVAQQVEAIARMVDKTQPMFKGVEDTLHATVTRIQAVDERSMQAWTEVGEQVQRKIEQVSTTVSQAAPGPTGLSREAEGLLRQIAAHTAPRPRTAGQAWLLALLPMLGVLTAVGALYIFARFGLLPGLP